MDRLVSCLVMSPFRVVQTKATLKPRSSMQCIQFLVNLEQSLCLRSLACRGLSSSASWLNSSVRYSLLALPPFRWCTYLSVAAAYYFDKHTISVAQCTYGASNMYS